MPTARALAANLATNLVGGPAVTFGNGYTVEPGVKAWDVLRDGQLVGEITSEKALIFSPAKHLTFSRVRAVLWDADLEADFDADDGYTAATALAAAKAWAKARLQ